MLGECSETVCVCVCDKQQDLVFVNTLLVSKWSTFPLFLSLLYMKKRNTLIHIHTTCSSHAQVYNNYIKLGLLQDDGGCHTQCTKPFFPL